MSRGHAAGGQQSLGVGFDTIAPADLVTAFSDLVFGAAGLSVDSGSYDGLNGALGEILGAVTVQNNRCRTAGTSFPLPT